MNSNWEDLLKERLKLYGHRNWIVIADSAYPAQSRAAIETIVTDEDQTALLEKVCSVLEDSQHATATVYTDKELKYVREQDAPGVTSYRQKLAALLKGYQVEDLPHDTIIWKLDRVADKFRVLLIKSNLRIPYTSVFFELECGYWNADAEKRLRSSMRSKDRGRKTPKNENGRASTPVEAHLRT